MVGEEALQLVQQVQHLAAAAAQVESRASQSQLKAVVGAALVLPQVGAPLIDGEAERVYPGISSPRKGSEQASEQRGVAVYQRYQ